MSARLILMGVIGRPHGVRGLVHVTSYTADPADLAAYGPLALADGRRLTLAWRGEGVAEIALVVDGHAHPIEARSAAERLTNTELWLERDRLPPPDEEEFYLADLVGLAAFDEAGQPLGRVAVVHDYGAGASVEIVADNGTPLIVPFTRDAVPDIDIVGRRLTVLPPAIVDAEPATEILQPGAGVGA
jgi:16S rRNA processing protein RimM